MKSAWVIGRKKIEIRELDDPIPANDEVIIRIKACGICGTDLHYYNEYPGGMPLPLGHEVSGQIETVGKGVVDLKPGDKVVAQNNIYCGKCDQCLNRDHANCKNIITYMDTEAGMAEFLRVKRSMVIPFDKMNFIEAAVAEPITVALDITKEAQINPLQNVCISGPGIIGLASIGIAKLSGAEIIVVLGRRFNTKRGKKRRDVALQMGASIVIDTELSDWRNEIKKDFPEGFERIIVTSPPKTIPPILPIASFGGIIAFNGISFLDENITFNANSFHFNKLKLVSSHAIPNWGFPTAFQLLKKRIIDYKTVVTHKFKFSEIERAFQVASSIDEPVIKVIVTF